MTIIFISITLVVLLADIYCLKSRVSKLEKKVKKISQCKQCKNANYGPAHMDENGMIHFDMPSEIITIHEIDASKLSKHLPSLHKENPENGGD